MRNTLCERDAAFAWQVAKSAVYATLSMTKPDGTPYAVPLNVVPDEVYGVLYFHCAGEGEKWEILKNDPAVCLTVVSHAAMVPKAFTCAYRSAMFRGRAQVVSDEGERVKAMMLLCQSFDPKGMDRFSQAMENCAARVVKIIPEAITGKEHAMPAGM